MPKEKILSWYCIVALLLGVAAQPVAARPSVGQPAPDFALHSNTGKNVRLSEYRGQVVMINFWATWCAPCRQELPLLNKIYDRYRQAGFVVLAVNIESDIGLAKRTANAIGLTLPVLFDNGKRVTRLYDPSAMPTTLLLDRRGRVRHLHLGYKPGYEEMYERQIKELLRE